MDTLIYLNVYFKSKYGTSSQFEMKRFTNAVY